MTTATTNRPDKSFRIGNVKGSIWKKVTDDQRVFYNTKLVRSYKDKDGNWQETDTYDHADLLCVAEVARLASDWLSEQMNA